MVRRKGNWVPSPDNVWDFCPYLKGIGNSYIISVERFLVVLLGELFRSGFWGSVGEGILGILHQTPPFNTNKIMASFGPLCYFLKCKDNFLY